LTDVGESRGNVRALVTAIEVAGEIPALVGELKGYTEKLGALGRPEGRSSAGSEMKKGALLSALRGIRC